MTEVLKLRLGGDVVCRDGDVGELTRIIFDPETHVATHLDVAPHAREDGRLVPIGAVELTDTAIHLACTVEQFLAFASDVDKKPSPDPALPAFDDKALIQLPEPFGFGAMSGFGTIGLGPRDGVIESDALPEGDVDLERGTPVYATDGHVGHAEGLIVSKGDFRVTHLLLGEGHLFGAREVAIPVEVISQSGSQAANLSLSKAEIHLLPTVQD